MTCTVIEAWRAVSNIPYQLYVLASAAQLQVTVNSIAAGV